MKWEEDFILGTKYLNKNLIEVTKDGVSITMHDWGASERYSINKETQHDYYRVFYILDGKGLYQEGKRRKTIQKGALILIPPDTPYQFESQIDLEGIDVSFSLNMTSHPFIQKLFNGVKRDQLFVLPDRNRTAAILLWVSILKLGSSDNTIYLKNNIDSLAITLFWSILKDFEKEILSRNTKQVESSASNLVYQAKLFIIDNLSKSMTLKDIADHLHISERHLSRLFNQELGQSFTTFIRKERIRKAGILLSDSNIPIKDIAEQTGFSSVHYFTNVFSSEMDMPPGQFRERFRHQNLIQN